jgi:HlyD family secretion protein
VEEQNRTVEIEVDLVEPGAAQLLLPGTSADVEVILEAREGVLRVPASALLEGDRVLVLADGTLAERRLVVGLRNWDFIEVVSGLAPGARVVTSLDRPEVVAGARAVESPASLP